MSGLTELYRKNVQPYVPRHLSGVTMAILSLVVAPGLAVLVSEEDNVNSRLKKGEQLTSYEMRRPFLVATIAALGALGALRSTAIEERRKKISDETTLITRKQVEETSQTQRLKSLG